MAVGDCTGVGDRAVAGTGAEAAAGSVTGAAVGPVAGADEASFIELDKALAMRSSSVTDESSGWN